MTALHTTCSTEPSRPKRLCSALEPDVGCRAKMLWRSHLTPEYGAERFCEALGNAGLQEVSPTRRQLLATFEHKGAGHRIVFVPRTGRIQLRLGALTPHMQRVDAAHRLYEWMCDVLAEARR